MKANRILAVVFCTAFVAVVSSAMFCIAGEPDAAVRPILDKLLNAVAINDYDSFMVQGSAEFKAGLTRQMFEGVSAQLSPRLNKGYDVTYLGELNQQGCMVHLWRLTYKDGGDDTLAKVVLKDGKVAGFWLQ
jgi:hypothetical protein